MEFLNEEEIKDIANEEVNLAPRDEEEIDIEKDLDDWVEDDQVEIKCMFNNDIVHSVDELVAHDLDMYGFDLKGSVQSSGGDDLSIIKLINFIRSEVQARGDGAIDEAFITALKSSIENKVYAEGDTYMKPVIEEDPLLFMYEEAFMLQCEDETD
jgi:type IV secretory pathway VirB4 component